MFHKHRLTKGAAFKESGSMPLPAIAFALIISMLTIATVVTAIVGTGEWEWRFAVTAVASACYAFSWFAYQARNYGWAGSGFSLGTTAIIFGWL